MLDLNRSPSMSKRKLLIIGTVFLICSIILNTTLQFFVTERIGGYSNKQAKLNRLILLTLQAENRGVLQYELADNLLSFNNAYRLTTSDFTILSYFQQHQYKINAKVANAVNVLRAGINYDRETSEEELSEVMRLVKLGDPGYAKLVELYNVTYRSYVDFRKKLVQDRDAINQKIELWIDVQHWSLFISVLLQMIALICFLFKDLKEKSQ